MSDEGPYTEAYIKEKLTTALDAVHCEVVDQVRTIDS